MEAANDAPSRPDGALHSPAAARNREPILAVLRAWLPASGKVIEVASGSGQHAAWFAAACPALSWQPTDADAQALLSIAAHRASTGSPNLLAPVALDLSVNAPWGLGEACAVVSINMIHIAPWAAATGLMRGAGNALPAGGVLVIYGPFIEAGIRTAPSNIAFDESLRARDPAWGLRRLDDVVSLAAGAGLALRERIAMPANNLSLLFVKG